MYNYKYIIINNYITLLILFLSSYSYVFHKYFTYMISIIASSFMNININ